MGAIARKQPMRQHRADAIRLLAAHNVLCK